MISTDRLVSTHRQHKDRQLSYKETQEGVSGVVNDVAVMLGRLQVVPTRDYIAEDVLAAVVNKCISNNSVLKPVNIQISVFDTTEDKSRPHLLTGVRYVEFLKGNGKDLAMIEGEWYLQINENGVRWPVPVGAIENITPAPNDSMMEERG